MGIHITQEGEERTTRLPAPGQPVEEFPVHDMGVFRSPSESFSTVETGIGKNRPSWPMVFSQSLTNRTVRTA